MQVKVHYSYESEYRDHHGAGDQMNTSHESGTKTLDVPDGLEGEELRKHVERELPGFYYIGNIEIVGR